MGSVASVAVVEGESSQVVENVLTGEVFALGPGTHVLPPLKYRWRRVKWHFTQAEVNGTGLVSLDTTSIPTNINMCFDPEAVDARTSDGVSVEVDLVSHFAIRDPVKAVTQCTDAFVAFETRLITNVVRAVGHLPMSQLTAEALQALLMDKVMIGECEKEGFEVTSIQVEGIALPEEIAVATNASVASKRKAEAEAVKEKEASERAVEIAILKAEEQAVRMRLEADQHRHKLALEMDAAKAAADKKRIETEAAHAAHAREVELVAAQKPEVVAYMTRKLEADALAHLADQGKAKVVFASTDVLRGAAAVPVALAGAAHKVDSGEEV